MHCLKPLSAIAVTGAVLASGMLFVSPANAAASPTTISVTCTSGSLVLSAPMVTLDSGDSFVFTNSAGGDLTLTLPGGSTASTSVTPLASTASTTITATAPGSVQLQGAGVSYACRFSTQFLSLNVPGGGAPSTAQSSPTPVVQQFGKPTSGTCDAAQPAGLSWAGVLTGGWGESWAEWMNGGKGGAVCTRTLVYSDSLGTWTVG